MMRYPLGFLTILLVLNAGLIRCYLQEDPSNLLDNQGVVNSNDSANISSDPTLRDGQFGENTSNIGGGEIINNQSGSGVSSIRGGAENNDEQLQPIINDETQMGQQQEKRVIGMPASSTSRDMLQPPSQINFQDPNNPTNQASGPIMTSQNDEALSDMNEQNAPDSNGPPNMQQQQQSQLQQQQQSQLQQQQQSQMQQQQQLQQQQPPPPRQQQQKQQQQQQEPIDEPHPSAPVATAPGPSNARGLGSDIVSAIMNPAHFQAHHQQQQQQQQHLVGSPHVRPDELPTIIEKNKAVSPQLVGVEQPQVAQQQQQQQQQTQAQQQSQVLQQQQQQQQQTSNSQLVGPGTVIGGNSTNLPMSSARTFDGWSNCVGTQSNKYGTCKNDVDCKNHKGRADGSCMGGFGVCCVMALSCGDKSSENNTFFANPDFPEPSWEARLCEVELKKKSKNILQIMIEFEEFELAPPNNEGECITDVFQVKLGSHRPSPYSLLRICGQNTGQHMYLDVSQIDEPLILSIATSGGGFPRRWSIRIVQMDEKNYLLAPPGCLQYYTDTVGHFRSFNLGRNLRNLYYAVCFRIDNGYSGIRFTENFFGMNGPMCRIKKGPASPTPAVGYGAGNRFAGAHPHHLVIPPPGYSMPPPKPSLAFKQQGKRFKRLAYKETTDSAGDDEYRYARTLHEHEHKHEKENQKHESGSYGSNGYPPQGYGPPPPGGYQQGPYGPPPPPPKYGYQGASEYGGHKDEKYEEYGKKHEHEHEHDKNKEGWSWSNPLGWGGKESSKKDEHGKGKEGYGYSQYQQGGYGQGSYGHGYGPQQGYGHSQQYSHQYSSQYPHQQQGYGQHYTQQAYGPQGGYGGYGPGEYHHKEIGKFGNKYEDLGYKHEKNHLGKNEEKKESHGGWWPAWGSKKDEGKDKKEKYYQHHEALFPMMHIPEMPHCEPRFCGQNDVITFPPSGDSIAEMCGNRFNRGRGPKIITGSPLVVYVSNRGHTRGAGFDINYEQVFYIPKPY